jgi:hypothetical protein
MRSVEVCRTGHLGGHLERCDTCGHERPAYNSCRNRHCPKCQSLAKARWLEARRRDLLPVGYFHTVFTLPHELNPLALRNKEAVYDMLFAAASETLKEFAAGGRHRVRGRLGFTAILHTWDQVLLGHVHLHCVIPGGALSADGRRWTRARRNWLFPVKALSKVFRGKFTARLEAAFTGGELRFSGRLAEMASPEAFEQLLRTLRTKPWVVYSKPPFAGPGKVLDYLGRYTHRVAISNDRILEVNGETVSFSYRDRAHGGARKVMKLPAQEFIRRFLLHVLPKNYMRVRHFGFLAGPNKGRDLARCRQLLGQAPLPPGKENQSPEELLLELTGVDLRTCPRCRQGRMRKVAELPRSMPGSPLMRDTS